MPNYLPRVMAVHDLSGFGRCSLSVALPLLSACGATCVSLPTAVLSAHTGIPGYTFCDLTGDMSKAAAHWHKRGIRFDALYTGYLGSERQLSIVEGLLSVFKTPATLTVVDPVLGDEGRLYSGLTKTMVDGMRSLCARADVITPNMTEAALLLDRPYLEGVLSEAETANIMCALHELGAKNIVLTGVMPDEGHIGAACYDGKKLSYAVTPKISARFDGTGDVFCSVLTGALIKKIPLARAAQAAADFTHDCINLTHMHGGDPHEGVDFEELLCSVKQRMEASYDQI